MFITAGALRRPFPFTKLALATAVAGALGATTSQAQETRLEEVIVTATPLRDNPLSVAQPVTVLAGDDLVRQISASIGETVEHELGMTATFFGPAASRPIIRGLGGDRVLVLQDGSSALDVSSLSQDHAVSIEAALADQVEIIKGPATLLYGSGAVGGIVNVIDGRLPSDFSRPPNGGALELRGDTALGEATAVGRVDLGTDRVRFHFDGFRRSTDDYRIPGFAESQALRDEHAAEGEEADDTRGRVANSASDSKGGAAGVAFGGQAGFVAVSVNRYDTKYGVPGGHAHGEEHADEEEELEEEHEEEHGHEGVRIEMVQDRYDFKAERELSGLLSRIRFRAGYNEYTHQEIEEEGEVGTQFMQEAWDARLFVDHGGMTDAHRGTVGLQYLDVDFQAEGEEAFVPPSRTRQLGVFAFEKWDFDAVTLELGARAENQEVKASFDGEAAAYDETAWSFSAGTIWRFAGDYGLAVNLTRSQRHPQATELFADGPHIAIGRFETGDPALGRETARNVDVTLRRAPEEGLGWSLTAFYNDFADYIYAAGTGLEEDGLPAFLYTQADAKFHGLEAELTFPLFAAGDGMFDVRLAADFVRGKLKDGGNLPQIPPLRAGIELHYERDRLHLGLEHYHYDRQDRLAEGERPTDRYNLLSADVSYRWDIEGGTLLLFVRGNNLLDEEARRHSSPLKDTVPLPGRSLTAGIRARF